MCRGYIYQSAEESKMKFFPIINHKVRICAPRLPINHLYKKKVFCSILISTRFDLDQNEKKRYDIDRQSSIELLANGAFLILINGPLSEAN